MRTGIFIIALYLFFCAVPSLAAEYETVGKYTIPAGTSMKIFCVSPDGRRVAYILKAHQGKACSVWVNGRRLSIDTAHVDERFLRFTDDGSKVIYRTDSGQQSAIWMNETKVTPDFPSIGECVFSRDGSIVSYIVRQKRSDSLWINKKQVSPAYGQIQWLVANPDGTAIICWAKWGTGWKLLVNGKKTEASGAGYCNIRPPLISSNGKSIACPRYPGLIVKTRGGNWVYKRKGPSRLSGMGDIALSNDGAHVAYSARTSKGQSFWIDDSRVSPYFSGAVGTPLFSPGGKSILYWGGEPGDYYVWRDEKRLSPKYFSGILAMAFSPDGAHCAYWGVNLKEGHDELYIDGQEVSSPANFPRSTVEVLRSRIAFSPDASKVAYIAWAKSGGDGLFINDVRISPRCSKIEFSPECFTRTGILAFACYFGDRGEFLFARR